VAVKSGPETGRWTTSPALSSVLPMTAPPGTPPPKKTVDHALS
jgi:hypothetical protein